MASRFKSVMSSLISDSQSAFIPGRNIQDNIILAHELVRGFERKNASQMFACKIDLRKAFDSVDWAALTKILSLMGFPDNWITWIKACIEGPSFSVLVNGTSCGYFRG